MAMAAREEEAGLRGISEFHFQATWPELDPPHIDQRPEAREARDSEIRTDDSHQKTGDQKADHTDQGSETRDQRSGTRETSKGFTLRGS